MAEQAGAEGAVTVWFDDGRTRWFAIPEAATIHPGGLFLRSSRGGHRTVDPQEVAAFEVDKDEAVRLMREELSDTVRRVKTSVQDLFSPGRRESGKGEGERMVRQLGRVFGSALSAVQETLTNPAAAEEVRTRSEKVVDDVSHEAEKVEPAVAALGERLKEALSSPEVASALENLGKGLQDLARGLQRGATEGRPAEPGASEAPAAQAPADAQDAATPEQQAVAPATPEVEPAAPVAEQAAPEGPAAPPTDAQG